MSTGAKINRQDAAPSVERFIALLAMHCAQIAPGGSFRRGLAQVGDVEVIAIPLPTLLNHLDALVHQGVIEKATIINKHGKASKKWGPLHRSILFEGVKFDLFLADEDNFGYIYWLRTGPDNNRDKANTFLATRIKRDAPFSIHGGYAWYGPQKLHVPTEEHWFALCRMPFIEPHERSIRTYSRLLKAKHTWGDPHDFIVRQLSMFDFNQTLEAEYRKLDSGVSAPKKRTKPWQWTAPWLLPDGRVWIYAGYGNFCAEEQSSERAQFRLTLLRHQNTDQRSAEATRLQTWLDIRAAEEERERYRMVADVLAEAFEIITEVEYA